MAELEDLSRSGPAKLSQHAQEIIKITRETEILQSFLRVDAGEPDLPPGGLRSRPAKRGQAEDSAHRPPHASKNDGTGPGPGGESRLAPTSASDSNRSPQRKAGGSGGAGSGSGGGGRSPSPPRNASASLSLLKHSDLKQQGRRGRGRRRRGEVRHEEIYTDKDRAAAVAAGSRDIKQSLSLKRRQDRNRALQIPDEADPSSFLALGSRELRTGDVSVAINFVHKALELNPRDKNALVARSKCYLLLGEPQRALQDAETALRSDKSFIRDGI